MITGVFGLPAIRETVKVLVDLKLWKTDIPLLTIDNTSVLLWIILVLEIGKRIKKYFEMRNEIDIWANLLINCCGKKLILNIWLGSNQTFVLELF